MPFYINKAQEDGNEIGQPLTSEHFSDATKGTVHKQPTQGNILFSGRRDGLANVIEYQNEIYNIWDKGKAGFYC